MVVPLHSYYMGSGESDIGLPTSNNDLKRLPPQIVTMLEKTINGGGGGGASLF